MGSSSSKSSERGRSCMRRMLPLCAAEVTRSFGRVALEEPREDALLGHLVLELLQPAPLLERGVELPGLYPALGRHRVHALVDVGLGRAQVLLARDRLDEHVATHLPLGERAEL